MQKNKLNDDLMERQNSKGTFQLNIKIIYWIRMLILIVLYTLLVILLINVSSPSNKLIVFCGIIFNNSVVSGIIAQAQVMVSVGIVLIPIKKSYLIALALNIVQAVLATMAIVFTGNTESMPGIFIAFITMIIIVIISRYAKSLNRHIEKVTKQKEELSILYEKDLITAEKMRQQNVQLIAYNDIMQKNEQRLHHLAFYDSLTELPNRKMMIDQIDLLTKSILSENGSSENRSFVFIFIDLDNFKTINDSMGHRVGDAVLNKIAQRWKKLVHKEDMLARFGGDEFALLIQHHLVENELLTYIASYLEILSKPIHINQKEIHVSVSYGVTIYPQDGTSTTEILKNADIALYKVKNTGKNGIQFYKKEMQEEILKRIELENGLKSAIQREELYLAYQPLYSAATKTLRGFETLARWHSKELGRVSPAQFIPIAEETGLIIEIGKWFLQTALKKAAYLRKMYAITPIVSVNISVVQMIQPNFVTMVKKVLEETGFDSQYLELEITESVFISSPDQIIEVLNKLRSLGIHIALDDFGTGYASLSYLQMLPIDTLKIDKTFIDKILGQNEKKQIVGSIIELAHQLGLQVVAEGVEKEGQLAYLRQQKCDYIQGYLLSKPMDEQQLQQLVIENASIKV